MPKLIFILFLFVSPLYVVSQTADFTFQSSDAVLCNPSSIQFNQTCTGNPIGFVWDFGNNTKGYDDNVSVTYTNAGTYTVKLIAIYAQKTVEVSKVILINPRVTASIGYDKNYICTPGVINFTGITNGNIANYSWDFGDSTGIVDAVTKDVAHSYANFGNYSVTLKATDITGCAGTATTPIKVIKTPIRTTISPIIGCIPTRVLFNALVTVPVNDFVTSYNWTFGDGSGVSTPINNTNHIYGVVGAYSPKLSIITSGGCTNTYDFPAIVFGTPPFNHIAYPKKAIVCGSETAEFVSKATDANRYIWNFGDGSAEIIIDTITGHKYNTLGTKTVKATPLFNGCPGTPISFDIEVVGVIAKYNYINTCTDKKTYSFTSTSLGNVSSYVWDFGDGSPAEFNPTVTHNFPDTGQFITSLTVKDSITGCSDTYVQTIYTANPVLVNPDSSICKNSNTSFSILNNYTDTLATYTWNIAGSIIGPSNDPAITIKADSLGNFNNFVTIKYGSQSCPDTVQLNHSLLVRGPDLKYTGTSPICFNTLTTLTNTSKPFVAGDSITLMYWNYGNTISNDTIYQPLPFQYKKAGDYRVILTATDINGCQDSLIRFIRVNPNPFLQVIPHSDTLCLGQTDTLLVFSSGDILWSPTNNISCSDCDTVVANPTVTTQYNVTATTPFNCSVKDSVVINVYSPFTVSSPVSDYYLCPDDKIQLEIDPAGKVITWSPATGLSNSTIYRPIASPVESTIYTATLNDSAGCFSGSAAINVVVKSLPTVDAGPDKIVPYNSIYTIAPAYSNNISQYSWSPSTLLSCNDCPRPTGTAFNSETYTIRVTSDSGCTATDNISVFVECKNANLFMPRAFTPNNDNLNDSYYPITRGFKTIIKFAIYNRQGKLIYEARNFPPNSKSFGWNGFFKGEYQPAAAYVYVLEALCEMGEKLTKTGSFLLLR